MCNETGSLSCWTFLLLSCPLKYIRTALQRTVGGQLLQGPGLRNETHLSVVCVIMDQGDTERMCRDAHCGQASCIRSLKGF